MKYVGVIHESCDETVFWFKVPYDINNYVQVGESVICSTRDGLRPGVVTHVVDGFEEEQVRKLTGNWFAFRNIVAVEAETPMSDVQIPKILNDVYVPLASIEKRREEYEIFGGFYTNFVVNSQNKLADGISIVKFAEKYGIKFAFCFHVTAEEHVNHYQLKNAITSARIAFGEKPAR